jgi:hypothetical protein
MSKKRSINLQIVHQKGKNSDLDFWLKKTPEERIAAVEFLRKQHYALCGHTELPRMIKSLQLRELKK